jgi:hypothetical protein
MNKNLAGGDKATVQALKDAGLNFQAIRDMKPEDAFLAITDAIQQIPDPMEQSAVALQLFGKGAASLLPGIKEGFRGAAASAQKMSEDTINSLENAQDAWSKLANSVTIATGTIIASTIHAATETTSSFTAFTNFAQNVIRVGVPAALALASAQDQAAAAAKKHLDVNLPLEGAVHKTAEQLAAEEAAAKKATDAIAAHAAAIQALTDKYSGAALAKQVNDLSEAMKKLGPSANFQQLADDIGKLFKEGANLTPQMLQLGIAFGTLTPPMLTVQQAFKDLSATIDVVPPKIDKVWEELNKPIPFGITQLKNELAALVVISPADMLKGVTVQAHDVNKALGELSQSFSQLAQIAGGGLGAVVRDLGTLVSSLETTNKSVKAFEEGKKAFSAGSSLAGIAGMASGIMGIASAAIAAGKAIANLFNRDQGRDLVKEWAQSITGSSDLNALHTLLSEKLPADAEKFWIMLTQGSAHGDPKAAQAAIDQVTKALDEQKTKSEQAGVAAVTAAAQESDAFKAAKDAVSTLDGQIKSLQDSIAGEAPEEFMGIVEQQTRARIAALSTEREAAQSSLEALTSTMIDSINGVKQAIEDLPKTITFAVNGTGFNPNSGNGEQPEHAATGGIVGFGRIIPFASGGKVGTDTVPAMLTPGEIVLNAAQQKRLANGLTSDGRRYSELQALRKDLQAQRDEAAAERQFTRVLLPKAIASALQRRVA